MTERPTVSIIIPAFNEGATITYVIMDVLHKAWRLNLRALEVIVVDDGSTDNTVINAEHLAEYHPNVRIIRHHENRGLKAAYETGLASARCDYVAWVPGDGEMTPKSITAVLRAIGDADLVVPYHGTPQNRPWLRRLLTWGSTMQLNVLLGRRLHYWNGPAVYPTAVARELPRTEDGFFAMAEMLAHALDQGLSYVEVPLVHRQRQHGVSKAVSLARIWAAQKCILRLWWRLRVAAGHVYVSTSLSTRRGG